MTTRKRSAGRNPGPAEAFTQRVERLIKQTSRNDAERERLRIAIREGLGVRGPHGDKNTSALEHALHCMSLVGISVEAGGLDPGRSPEDALWFLAAGLESLEALTAAVTRGFDGVEAAAQARRAA